MHPVWWFEVCLCVMLTLACVADDSRSPIVARAKVPNAWTPQGEISLFQRGTHIVVRTLLVTRFDSKVKRHIETAEQTNWGTGHDSTQYVAALSSAFVEYHTRRKTWQGQGEAALQIDFIDDGDSSRVEFCFPSVDKQKDGWLPETTNTWKMLPVTTNYLVRNQELILLDSFHEKAADVLTQLQALRESREGVGHE